MPGGHGLRDRKGLWRKPGIGFPGRVAKADTGQTNSAGGKMGSEAELIQTGLRGEERLLLCYGSEVFPLD